MIVVGVGCGPGMLTEEAIAEIRNARAIYGSKRSIELVSAHIVDSCQVHAIEDYSNLHNLPQDVVLLSTGDPMLAGLGKYGTRIVPGISSLQLAFSKLKLDLGRVSVIDVHGKSGNGAERVIADLLRGKYVFLLPDPSFKMASFLDALLEGDTECQVALCQDLGYPEERISVGTTRSPPEITSKLFSIVLWK